MLEYDFRSDLGYWIHIAAHRFEQAMNLELGDEGISYRQCQVLAWLALEGESFQARLAELMNVRPPSIVKVIDRMERDGLIVRKASASDRRKWLIRPTRKAVPVWKRIVKCAHRVRRQSERGLTDDEISLLRSLLERVHENLECPAVSHTRKSGAALARIVGRDSEN